MLVSAEPALVPALTVVNLAAEGASAPGPYRNVVVASVNDSYLRLSTFEGDYRWHLHPASDELFVVVDGVLKIDLAGGRTLTLERWDAATVPAGVVHRTRALGRTINLCFERSDTETIFVEPPATHDGGPAA